ncbi:ATP-binding cassette domain-containing protein [Litoribacter alkaliphilus]|uniref:ATP-binding cassette domain-containing protein n=1 Tax=Litoribacter ruber TaxID=702568 RepID=A0AAP2G202_9BACT|nr:ATP-binding cassette domain-containing protein [Litoribacter alkaliphilus]MBS9525007.1 ATP-binding cassette domain-containing protein [Litoribacter alkaliphilus]
MIRIENLIKQYKTAVVLNISSLEIQQGECFGLVGNNGAGKTTFFRMILDLVRPTGGAVLYEGTNVCENEDWKREVGAFLDEHMLLGYLTPDEYFETLRKVYGLSDADLANHLGKFTDFFNDEILDKKKYIRDLSKGNIKKVGIAAALIGQPKAVLLDEPFENLDPTSQNRLKRLVLEESQNGVTFLISSHDLNHVTEICDRIVLLEKGEVKKDLKDKLEMGQELDTYFNH